MQFLNQYSKLIVAILGAAGVALETAFPAAHWTQTVTAAVGAFLVYLVPNAAAPVKAAAPAPVAPADPVKPAA